MVVAMLSLSLYHIGLQLNYRAYTEEVMDFYNKLYLGANNFFVSEGGWWGEVRCSAEISKNNSTLALGSSKEGALHLHKELKHAER